MHEFFFLYLLLCTNFLFLFFVLSFLLAWIFSWFFPYPHHFSNGESLKLKPFVLCYPFKCDETNVNETKLLTVILFKSSMYRNPLLFCFWSLNVVFFAIALQVGITVNACVTALRVGFLPITRKKFWMSMYAGEIFFSGIAYWLLPNTSWEL